jgi:hypothetical protein
MSLAEAVFNLSMVTPQVYEFWPEDRQRVTLIRSARGANVEEGLRNFQASRGFGSVCHDT